MRRAPGARAGFTLVEILVSVVVLGIGVIALMGTSGMVTRMLGEGNHTTTAATYGERRLEILRRVAVSTSPKCADARLADNAKLDTTWAASLGLAERVRVKANAGAPNLRTVTDSVRYGTTRGERWVVLQTVISCR